MFAAQSLSNTAWAFSVISLYHEPLFEWISSPTAPVINELSAQDIGNLAWAFAKQDVYNLPLFNALARTAVRRIEDLNP